MTDTYSKNEYTEFLKTKQFNIKPCGFEPVNINENAFQWQKKIIEWHCRKGKSAAFLDTGLGKTIIQLEFANQVCKHTSGNVLILAPLAVASQTVREGKKFGIEVNICRTQRDVKQGINITNYEMLEHFDCDSFVGVVLDESSILKDSTGKQRKLIINSFKNTQYKLACTATPAPNDFMELGNHAEFLGVMSQVEMLATFFVHDGANTSKWRLKGHAKNKFWEWIASWAVVMTNPRDLGFEQKGYDLPPLNIQEIVVKSDNMHTADGQVLFLSQTSQTLAERRNARKATLDKRVKAAADIVNSLDEPCLVWCDLNAESELLTKSIMSAVEVKGSDSDEHKTNAMLLFSENKIKCLVTKPKIAGKGMNWQNCHNMIFVGLSDSFESYYQAIRRCYRFGQTKTVNVWIVISDSEGAVKQNLERKQADAMKMTAEMVKYTKSILSSEINKTTRITENYYALDEIQKPKWIGA